MARAKAAGSRKVNGTPRRLTTASFLWCSVVEAELGIRDGEDGEEDVGARAVDVNARKKALTWSGHSQDSARLTWVRVATQFAITGSTCSRLVRALAKQSAGTRVRSSPEMSRRLSSNLSCDMVMIRCRSISTVEGSGATCTRNFFDFFSSKQVIFLWSS